MSIYGSVLILMIFRGNLIPFSSIIFFASSGDSPHIQQGPSQHPPSHSDINTPYDAISDAVFSTAVKLNVGSSFIIK